MEMHPSPDQNGNGTTNYAIHEQLCSFWMLFYDGLLERSFILIFCVKGDDGRAS